MPTLQDVAKVAGVGVMSVSRVVNGTRKVSEATEQKVREAIRRIGYEPNEAARILKGQRAQVLGLIVPDIADPFFAVCANAIQLTARDAGYLTLMVASAQQPKIERQQAEVMMQRRVAGLIVVPMASDNEYLSLAHANSLPIVALDRPFGNADTDSVLVDNREASACLVRHLIEHGHQNILCVLDEYTIYTRQERLAGYNEAMRQAKLTPRVTMVGPTNGSISEQLPLLLSAKPRPTAIYTASDLLTAEVYRYLQKARIQIPGEIALVAFDDFDAATMVTPAITVVRQPVAELGHRAAELLLERIGGTRCGSPEMVVLKTELVIRESCGCVADHLSTSSRITAKIKV